MAGGWKLGVLGGSGLYAMPGLQDVRETQVETPWGLPSDSLIEGVLDGLPVVFLPRHGRGHKLSPTDLNYRANICALKMAGVTDIVSLSACGSLKESLDPGTFVVVDQFVDRTFARAKTFFGPGCVAHVQMADPVCGRLAGMAAQAARAAGAKVVEGGTYLVMEGPQFSTRAESALYRSWGLDVIGMTNMPEAKLAREAELPYATVAMVTDYDCWREDHADVDVADILRVLQDNARTAQDTVRHLAAAMQGAREPSPQGIEHALDVAIITPPEARDAGLVEKLRPVAGRVLG